MATALDQQNKCLISIQLSRWMMNSNLNSLKELQIGVFNM